MGLFRALPLMLLSRSVLSSAMVLHESISHVLSGFEVLGFPSPTQEIELLIAIVQYGRTCEGGRCGTLLIQPILQTVSHFGRGKLHWYYLFYSVWSDFTRSPTSAVAVSAVKMWFTLNVA
jgi:hypothetical protein